MGVLDLLFRRGGGAANAPDRQRVDETIERVVQLTNPRLRFARRYHARLAPAVATSLAHARELVAAVPPAREASAAAWSSDAYLRAFFATGGDIAQAFSRAPDLRAFFEQNPGLPEAYAVLGMEMTERKILGMALEGNNVRRDVEQTTVSFSDHRVRICGRTEPDLRAEVERRLLEQLALEGLAHVVADHSRRTELEQERALLKARLRLLERKGAGMRAALSAESTSQGDLARLQSQIAENTSNLDSLGSGAQMLDYELDHICAVLAAPAQHLYLTSRHLRIDRMNVVIEEGSAQNGTELEFLVARVPANAPGEMRAFSLVRFPRAELLPTSRMFADAARLVI